MPPTTYTVTRQTPDTYDFTVPGDPVLGTTVYFRTGGGNDGSVFIPANLYNGTHVRAAVAAKARLIDDISGITGTTD
jgi:hypothetical protein